VLPAEVAGSGCWPGNSCGLQTMSPDNHVATTTELARMVRLPGVLGRCVAFAGAHGSPASEMWPSRQVTVNCALWRPVAPADAAARLGAPRRQLGQPFTVDNRGGANGVPAASFVARSRRTSPTRSSRRRADHHPPLIQMLNYDPGKDLVPSASCAPAPTSSSSSPPAGPGKTRLAELSPCEATPEQLTTPRRHGRIIPSPRLVGVAAGLDLVHVPTRAARRRSTGWALGAVAEYRHHFGNAVRFDPAGESVSESSCAGWGGDCVAEKRYRWQMPSRHVALAGGERAGGGGTLPAYRITSWNGFLVSGPAPRRTIIAAGGRAKAAACDPVIADRLVKLGIRAGRHTPGPSSPTSSAPRRPRSARPLAVACVEAG